MSRFRRNKTQNNTDDSVGSETEETIETPSQSNDENVRVEIVWRNGAIARPFKSDLQKWLDQGWKLAN